MAQPQEIVVEIDEQGNAKVDVVGGKGKGCKKHLDVFRALGQVTGENLKPEYYKSETNFNALNVRNG